ARTVAWKAAWQGMKTRPLLGYGPENFSIPFDAYYSGGRDHYGFLETWYDRAHNLILDIGNSVGVTGLIVYFGILGSACVVLFRTRRAAKTRDVRIIALGIVATLGAYVAQNLLNFDTTTSFLYFTFLLGFIVFLEHHADHVSKTIEKIPASRQSQESNENHPSSGASRTGAALILIALLLPVLLFSFKKYHFDFLAANYRFNTAEEFYERKQYALAFEQYEKGLQVNAPPVNPYLRHRFSTALLEYAMATKTRQPDLAKKGLRKALALLDENIAKEFPYFTRDYFYAGVISTLLFETGEREYEAQAHQYFTKAAERSPRHGGIHLEWAKLYFVAGAYDEGTKKINEALAINQQWGELYWFLGIVQLNMKNDAGAERYFEIAQERGYDTKSEESLSQLTSIYTRMKEYLKAISVYDELIERKPNNIEYYGAKAALYKKAGD
ncbi:MAG: O-antigen ligase family protein, partial [Nitrososphaera sp.]